MREIKFRVWDERAKKFVRGGNRQNDFEEIYSDPPGLLFGALRYLKYYDYYILQQFTGLKDKNGQDIYEGDIIRHKNHVSEEPNYVQYVIEWKECGFCYLLPNYGGYEVIGNIFENPELLKNE